MLVVGHGYEKTEAAYERLGELFNRARRAQVIPFEVIRDDGIIERVPLEFSGRTDFWDWVWIVADGYQRERMAGQPVAIEVWCEATGNSATCPSAAAGFTFAQNAFPNTARSVTKSSINRYLVVAGHPLLPRRGGWSAGGTVRMAGVRGCRGPGSTFQAYSNPATQLLTARL
jgi:hypothetical protein